MKKVTLNALKESAESTLSKDELRNLKGGCGPCTGFYESDYVGSYNPTGYGYTVTCYDSYSTPIGSACAGSHASYDGGASGVINCQLSGYPGTTHAACG